MEPTITSAVLQYVNGRRASREIEADTAKKYRLQLLKFAEIVGVQRTVRSITRADIEAWFVTRLDEVNEASMRGNYTAVRLFFAWAVETELIDRSPCIGIRGPKKPESMPRSMQPADVQRVIDACKDSRDRLIVSMMFREGLRCVEISRLTFADVELGEGVMRVVGKGRRERWLPITMATQAAMREYLAEHPATAGPVLRGYRTPGGQKLSPNFLSRHVSDLMSAAGVKGAPRDGISAHAFRHTFASDLVDAGVDIEDVRQALGHATLATTSIYTKRRQASNRLRTAMDRAAV